MQMRIHSVRWAALAVALAGVAAAVALVVTATWGDVAQAAGFPPACAEANNCTREQFANAMLEYPGVEGVVNVQNNYAITVWERAEGGNWNNDATCNPLNTTTNEPGSTSMNSVGVQAFHNAAGHTCWYWGVKANGDTLMNGKYGVILNALRHPAATSRAQCLALGRAVAASPWGTPNFGRFCGVGPAPTPPPTTRPTPPPTAPPTAPPTTRPTATPTARPTPTPTSAPTPTPKPTAVPTAAPSPKPGSPGWPNTGVQPLS